MPFVATLLHQAIAAICPIHGIAVDDPLNKETWEISFAEEATKTQRKAAQTVVDNFDPETPTSIVPYQDFFNRFSAEQRAAIWAAAGLNPWIGAGIMAGLSSGSIDLKDPNFGLWMGALVEQGVMTQAEAEELSKP